MTDQDKYSFTEICKFCGCCISVKRNRYAKAQYICGSIVNDRGEYLQSFNCKSDVDFRAKMMIMNKMDKSFKDSFANIVVPPPNTID